MPLVAELKRRVPLVVGPLLGSLLVAYFAYHALEGDRGLRALQSLDQEIVAATAVRDDVVSSRIEIERRVARLHPETLDPDLLEERARLVLGYVPANAVLIGDGVVPKTGLVLQASVR